MVLKMLTDFTLMYNPCVGVLLKRDAEATSGVPPKRDSDGGSPTMRSQPGLSLFRCEAQSHTQQKRERGAGRGGMCVCVCCEGEGWRERDISPYFNRLHG